MITFPEDDPVLELVAYVSNKNWQTNKLITEQTAN
jgi:hypothetical protein